jgi:leucyl aminopeptidase
MPLEITAAGGEPAAHQTSLLAVALVGKGDRDPPEIPGSLAELLRGRFDPEAVRASAGHGVVVWTGTSDGPQRVLLVGAGDRDDLDAEGLRRFAGHAVRKAEDLRVSTLSLWAPEVGDVGLERAAQSLAEGAVLAAWRFRELKTGESGEDGDEAPAEVTGVEVLIEGDLETVRRGVTVGDAIARGENFARTLQARPGNFATPSHLAEEASALGAALGLAVTVFDEKRLREERMNAILAVAQGSDQEPRLIVLEHRKGPDGAPPLVLVGKGLTFDAGGISLKPPKGMEEMKFDMSGGAAVLGAMKAIAELDLAVDVVGVVPSSENLINGGALKPGDVIRTRSGKTVEVTNTDAEGRLILADALDYARSFEPGAMVDCATLTGAVVIGLGHQAAAVLGTDDALVEEVRRAGEAAGERCWPLPLWKEYRKQLDSETADLNNVGGRPAGTITAACFLREFVGDVPWAHLDIAGTAYGTEPLPYQRKGGYGVPTRLLVEWVRSRAG